MSNQGHSGSLDLSGYSLGPGQSLPDPLPRPASLFKKSQVPWPPSQVRPSKGRGPLPWSLLDYQKSSGSSGAKK